MEHSIPALIIGAILVLAAVLMAGVANSSMNTVNESWRAMESISEERLGTSLTVPSTQVDGTGTQIIVVLQNQGRTSIDDFSQMDVIINYEGLDTERHIGWLPFNEPGLSDNTWTVLTMDNDYHNPGIFDPGEQMTLGIKLNPGTAGGPNRWLVLATETGVAYTVYF